ncbi:hypothetical protein SKAU_G00006690 [Synaphobranchus kaupii]|uniref:WWE domain-containing protein n=1 Tax=Synaphobranchus kaupii TaxID=118154 RepID=A0A9Q1G991_SYNKA|nr:hypothetical protein SKAU_G00006690 [Synaphobranchus kaupii]
MMARPGSGVMVSVNGLGYPPQNLARVVVWEWLNEHGRWRPYSAAVCHHIENVLKGDARGTVVLGQVDPQLAPYIIDLQSMHQFRQDTVNNGENVLEETAARTGARCSHSSATLTRCATTGDEIDWPSSKRGSYRDSQAAVLLIKTCMLRQLLCAAQLCSLEEKSGWFQLLGPETAASRPPGETFERLLRFAGRLTAHVCIAPIAARSLTPVTPGRGGPVTSGMSLWAPVEPP